MRIQVGEWWSCANQLESPTHTPPPGIWTFEGNLDRSNSGPWAKIVFKCPTQLWALLKNNDHCRQLTHLLAKGVNRAYS